jgi:class 3 adenylate cyclase
MLGLHHGSVVSADTLVELLWGEDPPRTAAKAVQTHISSLRRALGDGFVLTQGTGWALAESEVDASRYKSAARLGRDAAATGDISQAVARFEEALALWRGIPELPDGRRGTSEKTRWIEGHAALVEDRADALLATARAAEIIGELEAAVAEAPLRERRWGQLMLALYRAGRQGDALGAYQRARTLLADELGIDPGPELRRLEAAIVAQDAALDVVIAQQHPSVMRAVTFLLTDIEGSTAAWEADTQAMAVALARHDELAEQVVTSRGGRLIKTRGEGDATFSVFERPSAAAAAAMELQDAITHEQWGLREPMRIRIALHTGEVELRDGDYFGRAVNRAARLRSLAIGGQILCSGATAELVIDSLPDDVVLADLGLRELRNLARPEHVFELRLETTEESAQPPTSDAPMERPGLPSVLIGTGPFVGRGSELERLLSAWQTSLGGGACAALIAGEPGVGKTRLAGEWSRQAYEQGAVVLYGRCDEDLGAPYQPFAEALRSLVPCVGTSRLRGVRGVEALLPLVPGLVDDVPDLAAPTRADPDTERYALFDAVVALLELASTEAPVVLVLDDLHWAAKPTLLLLRHVLRFGDRARVQIVGTYRSTDLDRSHPLAAMLADLHRDGTASRINLSGLDEDDVSAYVAKAGYDDEELGHALASVTGGNPFFLIEALRHVDESGGVWDPSTLPQGVREAVSRRLSRLPIETNKALAAAAVVGSRFALDLVERVVGDDLVEAFDEASKAGIVIEEPGGRYRFNHAIVRQSLLAELPSMRRMRLHQHIATTLEDEPGADDELLAELAHHYFECAWAGNAAKAVEYCRRAADQAMARLAYEGAAELYDHALHALEELDDELPDRDDQIADLLLARCEALLAAGDVTSAAGAVSQLQQATVDSARLSAWATCFDGQLSVLVHPERLDDVEAALGAAAHKLAEIDDAAGEAKAHTVRATCLARLGRVGDCEVALDDALTAARRARDHRRVNAVLAGAPLAALWGPNPVPRAGGRCLDVVRLLRITTDSPAVEATSTRCQAVLEAFRGRDAAARRMIDSARRTVTELGLRHALLEVEQFAGIVELVLDDPAAAEPHLRQACNGFRRMGLDADTAETAALLGRACLALNRDAEADELCTESERLAGHALKASIAWRTVRAQLLSRGNDHQEARRVAQAAITLAERTDGLVDHGDACLALATVLGAAGDSAGARAAAERAANLYERKGAAALADKARSMLDERGEANAPTPPEAPVVVTRTAAVHASERVMAAIGRKAWDEFERLFAPEGSVESRRKIVGFKQNEFPSDEVMRQTRRDLETGIMRANHVVIAVRGERLALARMTLGTVDAGPGAPNDEFLQVYGVDEEGRVALQIWFDLEDMDAALAELDALHARFEDERPQARPLFGGREHPSAPASLPVPTVELDTACVRVGERVAAAVNRGDWDEYERLFAPEASLESRRKVVGFTPIDIPFDDLQRENRRILETGETGLDYVFIAVRGERLALSRLKVSTGDASPGAPIDEFLQVYGIDEEGRVALQIWFDPEDIDAAMAELDALHARFEEERSTPLENAASRADDRFNTLFAGRRWDDIATLLTDDIRVEDRRRGLRRDGNDRATELAELRAIADVGVTDMTSDVLAIRGERLALVRTLYAGQDKQPEAFHTELIRIAEIDADERIVAYVAFDLDDFDAAIAELDARYLAGEAAAHAHTWSIVAAGYAGFNRRELLATTPDWVNIDHRRGAGFAPGDMIAYIRAAWDDSPDTKIYVAAVHRLSKIGAVVAHQSHGISQEGFAAEWRDVHVLALEGEMFSRCELFDEDDLDAAIARFDQLSRPAPRLENTASQVYERMWEYFRAQDWVALTGLVADDELIDDRRRVVNGGVRHGRNAGIQELQAAADIGFAITMVDVKATRGDRLALTRVRASGRDPGAIQNDVVQVVEIDADERIAVVITFDVDDIDAAFEELDARFLAGEADAHAHTWSVIADAYAALNRHEFPATTPDWVNIDHRGETMFGPGDLFAFLRASLDFQQDFNIYIESVHRLIELGAVTTYAAHATSQEGFEAEWRGVSVFAVEGDMVNRWEVFDEVDLEAAIARFDELSRPALQRLENTASRVFERLYSHVAAGEWHAVAQTTAENVSVDDRRRVVNAGILHGRDANIKDAQATVDVGFTMTMLGVLATRGGRLALTGIRVSGRDPEAIQNDALQIIEVDAEERIAGVVVFDLDDFDAAIAELDARYLAGEAAIHAHTWSVISSVFAALKRRELPSTTTDFVDIDHRKGTAFAPGELMQYLRAGWEINQEVRPYVEVVHRLNHLGAVFTHSAQLTSREGFEAEWRTIDIMTVDDDLINRGELFDEADLDTAIARFDQLSRPVRRLENAASQVAARFVAHFAAGDWDAMAEILADNFSQDDRRRVVGSGVRHGRDAEILDMRAISGLEITNVTTTVIATRGERLALIRTRFSLLDAGPEPFVTEVLGLAENDADDRITAHVVFDLDDFDAAIAELDARYLAGEAAAHSHAWSIIAAGYAALNRHELPPTTPDCVNIDHRRETAFGPDDLTAYQNAGLELDNQGINIYVEEVHQLNSWAAVITYAAHETSQQGFDAEWRGVAVFTIDRDLVNRVEVFDEADLDAAITKFDQLSQPAQRLKNAASQVAARFVAHFAAGDWDAMAEILADDFSGDDRRRVVSAGVRHGRDAQMANTRAIAELWSTNVKRSVIATRGRNVVLERITFSRRDEAVEAFLTEVLMIVEINADEKLASIVTFDLEDFAAALAELDARYVAGEAAAHAHTWLVITAGHATVNRRELPPMMPDCVSIDHRRGTSSAPGELTEYFRAGFELDQDVRTYVAVVHRLSDLGAVCTHAGQGVSREGFDAEWRGVDLVTVEGDMVSRCEVFDEADLDAAIARFEQLSRSAPWLENTASRANARFIACVNARDWDAIASILAHDHYSDDRRRVTGAGIRRGRDADIENVRVVADLGANTTVEVEVIATRGDRLVLTRTRISFDQQQQGFVTEVLGLIQTNLDGRIAAVIVLDPEDFAAAFEELDARYLAGEAAANARTWSLVAAAYECYNRRELPPTTPDWVNVDRRRMTMYAPGDVFKYVRGGWNYISDISFRIEAVHQLTNLGAVVTHTGRGTSQEGFDAEWREIHVMTVEGDLFNRSEMFDEADLDDALARFEELNQPTPHLENAASRVDKRFQACFAARDWDVMAKMLSDGFSIEDRRRVVNMGNSHGRDAELTVHAYATVGTQNVKSTVIATRAQRVALNHYRFSGPDQRADAFRVEMLAVVEIDADERMAAVVVFDADDIDAAITELDARYIAGEAAAHARTWSVIAGALIAHNRREIAATTPDVASIDHRRVAAFAPDQGIEYIRAGWDLDQNINIYIETANRVNDLGAVFTWAGYGTSHEGFDAEWRGVTLMTVAGEMISRIEVFDEADLDAAIARFDQLSQPAPRLENAASQAYQRIWAYFAARDWEAITKMVADNFSSDDRRRGMNAGIRHGRGADIEDLQASADIGFTIRMVDVVATRGDRLALTRVRASGRDPETIQGDAPNVVEIDDNGRIANVVVFDLEDFDAAIAELDARYVAGEAAGHAHVWSVIAGGFGSIRRYELPPTTPDCVSIDHRRTAAFAPGELNAYFSAAFDLTADVKIYVEALHRLNGIGAVCTHVVHGVSHEGFAAEWREVDILMVEGNIVNRVEMFDEADIDAALAQFDELQPQTPRLENTASQAYERLRAHFAAHDWKAMTAMLASDAISDDRRRTANAGARQGPEAAIQDAHAMTDLGFTNVTATVIAIRGERLVLMRSRYSGPDRGAAAFYTEVLNLVEIGADDRIVGRVWFDLEDIDAAFEELDARYLAGEAAAHARTWSVITRGNTAANRHETLPMTPDSSMIDHRLRTTLNADDLTAYVRASWDLTPNLQMFIESVHRLNDVGAVVTHASRGTSQDDFDAEWRQITLFTLEGDLCNRCEIFDEANLDAALARLEELHPQTRRLENAASQAVERFWKYFAAREWDALAETMADDICSHDRRRVVNGGELRGRAAHVTNMRAVAEVGFEGLSSTVIASRGQHLTLIRIRSSMRGSESGEVTAEMLSTIEIDTDNRLTAAVIFGGDDIDAAFAELNARYLAGEAAAHSHTWSVISQAYAALNQRALPATTPDWANVDHRHFDTIEPNALTPNIRAFWDITSEARIDVVTVHRLTNLGAVVAHATHATSQEGVEVESGEIIILMIDGDRLSRCEIFNEADLDAALARFDELQPHAPRLEHPVQERFLAHFAARNWDAVGQDFADAYYCDDRRRVVNAGARHGRDAAIEDLRVAADIGLATNITSDIIATRGERLFLIRARWLGPNQRPEDFYTEVFDVIEIDSEEKIAAQVMFDPNDVAAAFKELDARYLAVEAAAHSHTWSLVANACAAINRHELPELSSDWVNVDHRRGAAFAAGEMTAYIHDLFEDVRDIHVYVEVVHRLSNLGAVVTLVGHGTSQEGFQAEWREIGIFVFDGDLLSRYELFDEADLDAALARFEELRPRTTRLENAATQLVERFFAHFGVREWDAMAELLANDVSADDRRLVVNAGVRRGRDAEMANWRATADIWTTNARSTVATRGERLALFRFVFASQAHPDEGFSAAALAVVEINDDNRIAWIVVFEPDDIDAAFTELDARYLADEAASHAHIWTAITKVQAAYNRHEVPPTTADCVNIDHRPGIAFAPGDATAYIRATYGVAPNVKGHLEAVHRLGNHGVVVTEVVAGTSHEGFAFEWREAALFAFEGDMVSRFEIFDETDLDAALARFDELQPQARPLENAATQVEQRFLTYFAARDWDAYAEILSDDVCMDDRRHVVNAGPRHGRDAEIASQRAVADVGVTHFTSTVIAIRGRRLALGCYSVFDGWSGSKVLCVSETNAENQIVARVAFDSDDLDAAFAELDARYLAGEAAAHADTWSVMMQACAALNTREIFATTADFVDIDHRSVAAIGSGDLKAYIRAALSDGVYNVYIEAVHRLGDLGAVVTLVSSGTSQEGFDGEWRMADVFTVEGDLISHCEIFDEVDLDAALARFDELQPQAPRLENAATRADDRFLAYFAARNWAALAEILTDESFVEDRRPVVNAGLWDGRDAVIANMQAVAEAAADITASVIATRGERLALTRIRSSNRDPSQGDFGVEMFNVVEIDTDERIAAHVEYDADDIDAAFEELDARYLALGAATHASAWSAIAQAYTVINRHELPPTTPDWVNIDHRRGRAFAPGDLVAYLHATWDLAPDVNVYVEAVHRLSNVGGVVTHRAQGSSRDGFDAEWREVILLTFEAGMVNHFEVFDEADLDAALARFDELQPQTPRLENAASAMHARLTVCVAAHDWNALSEILADDIVIDDRRRVVNSGITYGRDAAVVNMGGVIDVGLTNISSTVTATRGDRLDLCRTCISGQDRPEAFQIEFFSVVEIDADERIVARVLFDPEDFDAAIAELDARYLAGEAAPHAHTWSVIARFNDAFNRQEIPATGWVTIDHRRLITADTSDLPALIREVWDLTPDLNLQIAAVHRLSSLGAVMTRELHGTSQEGFAAEWRMIQLLTVEGDRINRSELFDETDLAAALARFDELHTRAPRLENAAIRVSERLFASFAAGEWNSIREILANDFSQDDRRRVVGAGVRRGRDDEIADLRAIADLWSGNATGTYLATRGERLDLMRLRFSLPVQGDEAFVTEMLGVGEINAEGRIVAAIAFDPDDIDAAFEELDARYLAGEAAGHADAWSLIVQAYTAVNRHELPPPTPDWVNIDHRRGRAFAPGDLEAYLHATWDLAPDVNVYVEAVHRLSNLGGLVTHCARGSSQEGFDAEWREVILLTFEAGMVNHFELFDETDLAAALARFDELDRLASP